MRQIESQRVSPSRGRGRPRNRDGKHVAAATSSLSMWLHQQAQGTNSQVKTVQTHLQVVQWDPSSYQLQETTVQLLVTQSCLTPLYTQ